MLQKIILLYSTSVDYSSSLLPAFVLLSRIQNSGILRQILVQLKPGTSTTYNHSKKNTIETLAWLIISHNPCLNSIIFISSLLSISIRVFFRFFVRLKSLTSSRFHHVRLYSWRKKKDRVEKVGVKGKERNAGRIWSYNLAKWRWKNSESTYF